jgi:hypothetical protein
VIRARPAAARSGERALPPRPAALPPSLLVVVSTGFPPMRNEKRLLRATARHPSAEALTVRESPRPASVAMLTPIFGSGGEGLGGGGIRDTRGDIRDRRPSVRSVVPTSLNAAKLEATYQLLRVTVIMLGTLHWLRFTYNLFGYADRVTVIMLGTLHWLRFT